MKGGPFGDICEKSLTKPKKICAKKFWSWRDSNPCPSACHACPSPRKSRSGQVGLVLVPV